MEPSPEVAEAARLAINLSVAGVFLLILEVIFFNRIFAIFGGACLLGALLLSFKGYGLVIGMLFMLAFVTVLSLGFLIAISCFPKLPFSQAYLRRTRARLESEEAAEREREDEEKEG